MTTRPIIGLEAIHREYFVSKEGEEILPLRSFKKMSKEMQEAGVVARVTIRINGHKKVRIVALEPFFSVWRQKKLCGENENSGIESFMGVPLK
jgi:hypothetical protein